jgi:Arc/MetJ-type ribon-helix-helix transcriptional regulator
MTAINVRFPVSMFPLVEECIKESPIEFGSMADFIRRAIENELRRRGKIKKFAQE